MRNAFSITGHADNHASDSAIATLFARIRTGMERRRVERAQRRQLMRELSAMSDRDLAELGIGRGDFADMVQNLRVH